jgi:hypothetical protein
MTNIVELAKTCGADGDAIYCWNIAKKVAEEVESLRKQLKHSEMAAEAEAKYADELRQQLAEYQAQLKQAYTWLEEAAEDIADWGAYASEYFQEKHQLKKDVLTYKNHAVAARAVPDAIKQAIEDEKQNPWKRVIINELIIDGILANKHESDPVASLDDAITWSSQVALDPAVSKAAQELVKQAKQEALLEAADKCVQNVWTGDFEDNCEVADKLRHMAKELE